MADRAASTEHRSHDLELVAGLAAGDLASTDAARAEVLVASCSACAGIAADLRSIAAVTRGLPSAFDPGSRPAPRDYRLTAADAERLARTARFGLTSRRSSATWLRRAGVSLATFGLVGLLVSAMPFGLLGGAGAALAPAGADREDIAASAVPQAQGPQATAPSVKSSGGPERDVVTSDATAEEAEPILSPIGIVGAGCLLVGLALILASHRGYRAGP